ncbi:MAG: restriction endonuclease subunit S [Candidatus Rokubacteria bacterium]|nr:restriction endonuclease subunit S [Candidatus Rokubacteria bacterium]
MVNGLKPYSTYKDSGVPWLGEVPEHWEVKRGKALFRCIDVRSSTGGEELLTVSSDRGVVPRSSTTVAMFKAESYLGYKLCWPGDLVINSLWAWGRGLGVSRHHGIVSSAYGVYRLRPQYTAYTAYIHELVRSTPFNWELRVRSKGIWISRLQLTDEAFLGAPFALPPAEEQGGIVRFLDHADRRTRRYIRAKQKLIKLLEEQKQAIIHRAVTRGLDPNVCLKPSGVEWLGEVPEHWALGRLKDAAVVQTGLTLGKNYRGVATESRPYLRVANVQHGRVDLKHVKHIDVPPSEAAGATLNAGDVLMTEGGDIDKLGRGCVWRDEIPGCLHQNHVFAVRCRQDVLAPEFLVGLMTSHHGRAYFQLTAKQTTNLASTNSTTLRAFPVVLPPVAEQRTILHEVARHTSGLHAAMARTENEIDFLREYRTRLIADVVTGKLDVRDAAVRLPEEAEEPAPLDETEMLPEEDEDSEGADLDAAPEEAEA